MRRTRVHAVLLVLPVMAALIFSAVAVGQEGEIGVPYGKYTGSAVGVKAGGSSTSAPIGITVYLRDAGDDQVEVTFVTSKLPIPISVKAPATKSGSLWEIPVSVDMSQVRVSGNGLLHVAYRDGTWKMWGEGSGSALGKQGSGRGSAKRVSGSTSTADQVMGALGGFFSFGASEEEAADLEVPEPYDPEQATDTGETPPVEDALPDEAPLAAFEMLSMFGLLLLMAALGLFL